MSPECNGLDVVLWQALDQLDSLVVFAMRYALEELKTMFYEEASQSKSEQVKVVRSVLELR